MDQFTIHWYFKENYSLLQGTFGIQIHRSLFARIVRQRSERRKTEGLLSEFSYEEQPVATQMKLQREGKTDAANVIKKHWLNHQRRQKIFLTFNRKWTKATINSIGSVDGREEKHFNVYVEMRWNAVNKI